MTAKDHRNANRGRLDDVSVDKSEPRTTRPGTEMPPPIRGDAPMTPDPNKGRGRDAPARSNVSDQDPPAEVAAAAVIVDAWVTSREKAASAAGAAPQLSAADRFAQAVRLDKPAEMPPWKSPAPEFERWKNPRG
jgi:hypothetical protein